MFTQIALSKIDAIQTELAVLRDRIAKLEAAQQNPVSAYKAEQVRPENYQGVWQPQVRNDLMPPPGLNARNDNAPQGGLNARNDISRAGSSQFGIGYANDRPIPPGYYRASTLNGYTYHPDRRKATTERRKS